MGDSLADLRVAGAGAGSNFQASAFKPRECCGARVVGRDRSVLPVGGGAGLSVAFCR